MNKPIIDPTSLVTLEDLKGVKTSECGEAFCDLKAALPFLEVKYKKLDMTPYLGNRILVRQSVAKRLSVAYQQLQQRRSGTTLSVCYGYRSPAVQERYYTSRLKENRQLFPDLSAGLLDERTHTQVAYPAVAGHPTGGAVDVTILDEQGRELAMGTEIASYDKPEKCFVFAEGLSEVEQKNRLLLRSVMMEAGFAPFNGEWWHYSYGDREWAFFYRHESSLYEPVELGKTGV